MSLFGFKKKPVTQVTVRKPRDPRLILADSVGALEVPDAFFRKYLLRFLVRESCHNDAILYLLIKQYRSKPTYAKAQALYYIFVEDSSPLETNLSYEDEVVPVKFGVQQAAKHLNLQGPDQIITSANLFNGVAKRCAANVADPYSRFSHVFPDKCTLQCPPADLSQISDLLVTLDSVGFDLGLDLYIKDPRNPII